MSKQIGATKTLFVDNFTTNGKIDSTKWNFNEYKKGGSFYPNTQQRQELPSSSDGVLRLRLDTHNPSDKAGKSFYGSEAITKQLFSVGSGVAFEAKARYVQDQRGIIGGFFTFAGPANTHDEIDFELISNSMDKIQTNIYHNEPLGNGHPISYPVTGSLLDFHTYRIEWLPNSVRWFVDGALVRTESQRVPEKAMAMHFNIWGPPSEWETGDASLVPVGSAALNKTFWYEVDSVKVEQLAADSGTNGADSLKGTGLSDWLHGAQGDDKISGGNGNDTLVGQTGNDILYGQNGDDHLSGGSHSDTLIGGKGDDQLVGGAGRDVLTGGLGADQLSGGAWADRFVYNSIKDSTVAVEGRDTILDFSRKAGDRIDLSAIDANTGSNGNQAFSLIGAAAFSEKAGELRYENVAGQTILYGDVNGDGVADFSAALKGAHDVTKAYFIL